MAIKSCSKRIATNCFGTQTIQPWGSNAFIGWVCPECARMLHPRIESINLTQGGKDGENRPRPRRIAGGVGR